MSKEHRKASQSVGFGCRLFPSLQFDLLPHLGRIEEGAPAVEARPIPPLETSNADDALEVAIQVPGLCATDITVSVVGDAIVVEGGPHNTTQNVDDDGSVPPGSSGLFRRVIEIGFTPGEDAVQARLADSVLHLTIGAPVGRRSVPIETL